jgi:hypothetical protein
VFEVKGSLIVANGQGPRFIVPANQTVQSTKSKIDSGTSATFRINADATVIDTIAAVPTLATDSSPAVASITADQILTMDITAVSGSPVGLLVEVLCKEVLA